MRVTGVGRRSIQGDVAFADVLARMGATDPIAATTGSRRAPGERCDGIDARLHRIPDAAMTLAVVALFAQGPTTLTGIASWRVKETDRIAAMATELAQARRDGRGGRRPADASSRRHASLPATIDTYDDHRMAMCFSLAAFGGVAGAHQRSRLRAQDVSRLLRRVSRDRAGERRVSDARRSR